MAKEQKSGDYLTIDEIAAELGFSRSTVKAWIRDGELKVLKFGRAIRVRRTDFLSFLQSRELGGDGKALDLDGDDADDEPTEATTGGDKSKAARKKADKPTPRNVCDFTLAIDDGSDDQGDGGDAPAE